MAHKIPVPPTYPLSRGHSPASSQGRSDDDIILIEDSDYESDGQYYAQTISSRKEKSKIDTTHHCWKLTKAPSKGKDAPNWKRADRAIMSLPSDELAKQVRRQSKINPLLDTYEKLTPDQRQHVEILIREKQRDEKDSRVEWELAGIHREITNNMKTMVRETKFIRVILVRKDRRKEDVKATPSKSSTETSSDIFDLNDKASLMSLDIGGSKKDRSVRNSRPQYHTARSNDSMPQYERVKESGRMSDKGKGKDKVKDFSIPSTRDNMPFAPKQAFPETQTHWTSQTQQNQNQNSKYQPHGSQLPFQPAHQSIQAQISPQNQSYVQAPVRVLGQPVSQQPGQVQMPGPSNAHQQQPGVHQYVASSFANQVHKMQPGPQQQIPTSGQHQTQSHYAGMQQQQHQQQQPQQHITQPVQPYQQPQQPGWKPDPHAAHPIPTIPTQQHSGAGERAEVPPAPQAWTQTYLNRLSEGNPAQQPPQGPPGPLHTHQAQTNTGVHGQQYQQPPQVAQAAHRQTFDNIRAANPAAAAEMAFPSHTQAEANHFGQVNGGAQVHRTFTDARGGRDGFPEAMREQHVREPLSASRPDVNTQSTSTLESLRYASLKIEQQRLEDERRLQEKVMSWARQAQANPSRSSSSLEDESSTPPTSLSGTGYPAHRKPQAPVHRSSSDQVPRSHSRHEKVDIYPARSGQRATPQTQFKSAHDRRRHDRPIIVHRHTDSSARNTRNTKHETWSCSSDDEDDANYIFSPSSRSDSRSKKYDSERSKQPYPDWPRRGGSDRGNSDAASVMAEMVSKMDRRLQDMEDKEAEKVEKERLEKERREAYERGVEDGLTWKKSRPTGFGN